MVGQGWVHRSAQNGSAKCSDSSNSSCKRCKTYLLRARSWRTSMGGGFFCLFDFVVPPYDLDLSRAFKSFTSICAKAYSLIRILTRRSSADQPPRQGLASTFLYPRRSRELEHCGPRRWSCWYQWLGEASKVLYWEYTAACHVESAKLFLAATRSNNFRFDAELVMEKIRKDILVTMRWVDMDIVRYNLGQLR